MLPAGEREENIPCNLNNTQWFDKIDASNGAIFFASGVFYYFLNENIEVSSRGYMLGYQNLKTPSVSGFFRFLAKLGDNGLKMQIVKISFKKNQ